MNLCDFDGTMKHRWQLGYGDNAIMFELDGKTLIIKKVEKKFDPETGQEIDQLVFNIDAVFKLGTDGLKTDIPAVEDDDVVNLRSLNEILHFLDVAHEEWVTEMIKEALAGFDPSQGGTGGFSNQIPAYFLDIDSMNSDFNVALGDATLGKFVDRIVFEHVQDFYKKNGAKMWISIGTQEDKDFFVPKFDATTLTQTKVIDIQRTITRQASFFLYAWTEGGIEEPEPPEEPDPIIPPDDPNIHPDYEQHAYCAHEGVTTSLTHDASLRVWTATYTGNEITPGITFPELFGEVEGNYADVSFSIPVTAGRHYKIVQRNPALSLYPDDHRITQEGDEWVKIADYVFTEEDFNEDGEVQMSVLLGQSSGNADYCHMHFYDMDGENPEDSYYTIHIKNELNFIGVEVPEPPETTDPEQPENPDPETPDPTPETPEPNPETPDPDEGGEESGTETETETETVSSRAMKMYRRTASPRSMGDTGQCRIRIITF